MIMINRLTILTTITNTITINVIDPLYRHHRRYGYRYHTHHQYIFVTFNMAAFTRAVLTLFTVNLSLKSP